MAIQALTTNCSPSMVVYPLCRSQRIIRYQTKMTLVLLILQSRRWSNRLTWFSCRGVLSVVVLIRHGLARSFRRGVCRWRGCVLVVSGRHFRLPSRIGVHWVALRRRCSLIVLRLSVPASYHPSVVGKWLQTFPHATTGVEVASDEEDDQGCKDHEYHSVSNGYAGLSVC